MAVNDAIVTSFSNDSIPGVDFGAASDTLGEIFTCTACNIKCSGRIPYEQHISGAHHRKLLGGQLECETCNLRFLSKANYEAHVNGAKHKRKVNLYLSNNLAATNEALPELEVPTVSATSPLHGGDDLRCIACNLECSSSEQLTNHLNGRRHARRCKVQADALVETVSRGQDSSESSIGLSVDQGRPEKGQRKRALISYTKAQMEGGLERLRDLEAATTQEEFSLHFYALPNCLHRNKKSTDSDSVDTESEPKRIHLDDDLATSDRPFCPHLKCMVARALKFYEFSLTGLHGAQPNGLDQSNEQQSALVNADKL